MPEALSTETRLHRHDEHEVHLGEVGLDRFGRCAGVEHDAVLAAERVDAREGGGVVVSGLDVDADEFGSGFGEGFDVAVRLVEHEVNVEEELRVLAQGGDGLWTK